MVRLERETSNSFGADLFETLEHWEAYLKAEQIDFEKLSKGDEIEALPKINANNAEVKAPTRSDVKPRIQRLEP